jgi:hypothetical protein
MVQQYFSDAEWSALTQAPLQTLSAIFLADKVDPVSFLKELQIGFQVLAAEQQNPAISNDLIKSIVNAWNAADTEELIQGEELLWKKQSQMLQYIQGLNNAAEGEQSAIAHLEQVAAILEAKVTGLQSSEYKSWLLSIAQKTAEAVRERGFFGMNISDAESSMIKKISRALNVKS